MFSARQCVVGVAFRAQRLVHSTVWLCLFVTACLSSTSVLLAARDILMLQVAVKESDLPFKPVAAKQGVFFDAAQLAETHGNIAQLNVMVRNMHEERDVALALVAAAQDAAADARDHKKACELRVAKARAQFKERVAEAKAELKQRIAEAKAALADVKREFRTHVVQAKAALAKATQADERAHSDLYAKQRVRDDLDREVNLMMMIRKK